MVGEFTGIIRAYEDEAEPISEEDFARPATGATREVEAAERIVAGRADLARPYAPPAISAIPWGMWDADRAPMRPSPVLILAADLTELPAFRGALAVSTASARECLFGCRIDGGTWGERMVCAGTRLLAPQRLWCGTAPQADAEASRREPYPGTPEPPEIATAMEACDALNPVPAELAGGAA
jgi:hypothetical protein